MADMKKVYNDLIIINLKSADFYIWEIIGLLDLSSPGTKNPGTSWDGRRDRNKRKLIEKYVFFHFFLVSTEIGINKCAPYNSLWLLYTLEKK